MISCLLTLCAVCSLCAVGGVRASDGERAPTEASFGGHSKYQFLYRTYPKDSAYRGVLGSSSIDQYLETRLKFAADRGRWDFKSDYQFVALRSDTLRLAQQLPGQPLPADSLLSDRRRWWRLSRSFGDGTGSTFVHRLDRLSLGYTTERMAWRFGRQAVSWGNGLVFTPMDVFNPFDPAAVDKEYKTGDDMLYGQYLFAGGSDLQGVAVLRRDPRSGEVAGDQSSLALKYHGFRRAAEFDLLAAAHFGDALFGAGGNVDLGGAIWRGDLTWTRTGREDVFSAVTSLSYSWTWGGRNISGAAEYYYNGFGLDGGPYGLAQLARHPELLRRLERGELFTLGRHYLAGSATVEMTPLFLLIPNVFVNLQDPSALFQLVGQYGVTQNLTFLCAVNLPLGPGGSEYGGIDAPAEGVYFSSGPSLFGQLAWYF